MANTKHLNDTAQRKAKKRELRKAHKAVVGSLNKEQRRKFRKGEVTGVKTFLAQQK
jgi:hypothetical protein